MRRVEALGDEPFHVGGAATVDSLARDFEHERLALPSGLAVEGDGVDVSGNYQAVGARRSEPCDQVDLRDAGELDRLQRGFESPWRELAGDVFHRVAIAFRADSVECDEPLGDVIQIIIHGGTGTEILSGESHKRQV